VSYPLAGRDELARAIPRLRSRYDSYADFGASRIEDIFSAPELRGAQLREAHLFASSFALNGGNGTFTLHRLPTEAQFAPVYAVLPEDFDGDSHVDLLLAGNFHGVAPVRGRYDASYGLLLRGNGAGRFEPVELEESGVIMEGQARGIQLLRRAGEGRLVVVARNDNRLQLLHPVRWQPRSARASTAASMH
jgi:hypothetical protein